VSRSTAPTPKKDTTTGTWYFVFDSVHARADGTRRQIKRRGFPTRREAVEALAAARREDDALSSPVEGLTVRAVLGQFVRVKELAGRAPGTIESYRWAAAMANERWGGWPAAKLTDEDLDAAYLELLKRGRRVHRAGKGVEATEHGMAPRSVEILHKTVKAAFALAVDKGQLVRNPARLATPPAVVTQRRLWWTPAQVGAFLSYVDGLERPPLPVGLIDVLVDVGGRRGEVLGLRWSDVDLDASTATIAEQIAAHPRMQRLERRPTKRPRSKSTVGLHPSTVVALRRRRSAQAAERLAMGGGWPGPGSIDFDLIFTWPDGRAIHPNVLTRMIGRLSVAAGLPRLTPHGLRHSFASAALQARVPVEVVAARLGNTPRVVQEVYAHVIPADDQAAAQLVGDLYRSGRS
jgi:integrase